MVDTNHVDWNIIERAKVVQRPRGNKSKRRYLDLWCAFDIETTKLPDDSASFMYVWQFQIDEFVTVIGRTWDDFLKFLKDMKSHSDGLWICCYVFNLSYEFCFLKGIYDFDESEVFCMDSRKVLKCDMMGFIEFRCAYLHSNMNLDAYTKRWGTHKKQSGKKFNYNKIRYPWTRLTKHERKYIQYDVLGLVESLKAQAKYDGHNFHNFPLTSTGYVRKECQKRMRSFPRIVLEECLPDADILPQLNRAFRGGNTHCNRHYAGRIMTDVKSWDIASSYPAVMMTEEYPMGKWFVYQDPRSLSIDNVIEDIGLGNFGVIKIHLWDVKLSNALWGCPYIPRHKCDVIDNAWYDNGRVLSADYLEMYITSIDLDIILSEYDFSDIQISYFAISKLGKLPSCMTDYIIELFDAKTKLKHDDPLAYALAKERINSLYGMSVQNPLKEDVKFRNNEFVRDAFNLYERVEKLNHKAFNSYAWGVAITSFARFRLELALQNVAGNDMIYVDTDSVKFIGNHSFKRLNEYLMKKAIECGAYADDVKGNRHYMGVFEQEETYSEFKALHSKCYAYSYSDGRHGATISGVNKSIGADELWSKGGLQAFNDGFTFRKAGGVDAVYNDDYHQIIDIEGHRLEINDNVVLKESTYTVGMTGEYKYIIEHPAIWLEVSNSFKH